VRNLGTAAASRMFARAGVGISDVDVLTVYDANSFEVLRQIEVLGVCGEGEGGPYVEDVGTGLDSPIPVNPDGGCLAYTWNGTQQQTLKVVELVRQLRGTAVHQVAGAEIGLAVNAGTGAGHLADRSTRSRSSTRRWYPISPYRSRLPRWTWTTVGRC